jgi:DNA invertase Pin-like site-specific DNA recombinase
VLDYVSYLRVSTQRQGQSGLGIEAQRTAVEQYVAQTGGTLLKEFVEVESGSGKSRPILVQSISLCRRTKATLLIAKLDRLARNVAFVSSLMESSVEFVAADAPYANRLMIHILAAFAEHERTVISERTRAALSAAKARGVVLGKNGRMLAQTNRCEAEMFAASLSHQIENARKTGATTLRAVAQYLNSEGSRTRSGAPWSSSTVHRLLRRLSPPPGERCDWTA